MTLQEKIPCSFCKNKYSPFNVQKHEVQCAMNPKNKNNTSVIEEDEEIITTPSHSTPHLAPTKIRNVIQLPNSGLSAVFRSEDESETIVPISFVGTIIIGEDELPSLLIVDGYGFLKAPSSFERFRGIFPDDQLGSSIPEEQEEVFVEEPEPEVISEPNPMTQENTVNEMLARIKEVKPT